MKRIALALTAIVAVTAILLPAPTLARFASGGQDQTHIGSDQTINDDLYITGRDIDVEGTVNGDVYAAGSSVTIRGTVNGDVIAAGSDVLIGGTVRGSVRAAGSTVRLAGATVGNSVSAFGSTFTVEKDSNINGGLNFLAGTTSIRGSVGRSLVGGGSAVTISGTVKDVDAAADLTLESSAVVNGHVNYYGDNQLHRDSGAQVQGDVQQLHKNQKPHSNRQGSAIGILWSLASLYVLGALFIWLLPRQVAVVSATVQRRPAASLGVGILATILLLPLMIVLLITLVGIPVAILLGMTFIVAAYLAKFFVGLAVGGIIARRTDWKPNPYADVILGLLLLTLLELIPIVGIIVRILVFTVGVGAVVLAVFNHYRSQPAAVKASQPETHKSTNK